MDGDDMFTESIVTVVAMSHHDDDLPDDDHNDNDHRGDGNTDIHSEILSSISRWNTGFCCSLMLVLLLISLCLNYINASTLMRKRSSSSNQAIILLSSGISITLYSILLPMTIAGVCAPGKVITETYCYLQESLTLAVVLLGFFMSALTSFNRMVVVKTGRRDWWRMTHLLVVMLVFFIFVVAALLIPLFAVKGKGSTIHEHGCHLWSLRVDPAMWYTVYTLLSGLLLCLVTMAISYVLIYRMVVHSIASMAVYPTTASMHNGKSSGAVKQSFVLTQSHQSTPQCRPEQVDATPRPPDHFQSHRRVAKIAFMMVTINVLIWIPWSVISWISLGSSETSIAHELRVTTMVIGYIPAAVDPVLNMFMSPLLKTTMRKRLETLLK